MTISIDSRRAGAGKTTQGIYPRIRALRARQERVLLVVPSQYLQQQYAQAFSHSQDFITIINSELHPNEVVANVQRALAERNNFICITNQAWVRTHIDWATRCDYHIIIDEIVEPWNMEIVEVDDPNVVLNLNHVFDLAKPDPGSWNLLSRRTQTTCTLFGNQWNTLMNPNIRVWCKWDTWQEFISGLNTRKRLELCCELDPDILRGWHSVWIAAAAFESTTMCLWLDYAGFNLDFVYEFEPHTRIPRMWFPQDFRWSQKKRQEDPTLIQHFYNQIELITQHEPCIIVRNNSELKHLGGEKKINHNSHGLNTYSNLHNVCLATALNPNPIYKDFLMNRMTWSRMGFNWDKRERDQWVIRAFAAYTFYQIIMRSSLRDPNSTELVRVFVFDTQVGLALADFFLMGPGDVEELQVPVTKKIALTGAERARNYRDRQRALKNK